MSKLLPTQCPSLKHLSFKQQYYSHDIVFSTVYQSRSYIDVVSSVALKSMNDALEEAKAKSEYPSKGKVCDNKHYKRYVMMVLFVLLGHD